MTAYVDDGNAPVRWVAFLCQSEALLAKVEQLAAESRVNRTINQALSLPWTVAFSVSVLPIPPAFTSAKASMPIVLSIYAMSLRLMRIFHFGMDKKRAAAVQIQNTKKPIILAESRAEDFGMVFGIRAMEGKMQWSMV